MITITRRLELDYGHRVLGHEGKCRHLHGHRGVVLLTVRGPELDALGRVVDFSVLKGKVGGWVDAAWDHALLLNPADPLLPALRAAGERHWTLPRGNPTAELLAAYLADRARELLPSELEIVRIRFYETPNSFADYTPDAPAA